MVSSGGLHMYSLETEAYHPYFRPGLVIPEQYHQTLLPLTHKSRELSRSVIGGSRLSKHPVVYSFGVLRRILDATPIADIDSSLQPVYREWTRQNTTQSAIERAQTAQVPQAEIIETLAQIGDPAIFVIQSLEKIRISEYDALHREPNRLAQLHTSYDLLLRSIHGPAAQQIGKLLLDAS